MTTDQPNQCREEFEKWSPDGAQFHPTGLVWLAWQAAWKAQANSTPDSVEGTEQVQLDSKLNLSSEISYNYNRLYKAIGDSTLAFENQPFEFNEDGWRDVKDFIIDEVVPCFSAVLKPVSVDLIGALKFYADEKNYKMPEHMGVILDSCAIEYDGGKKAKTVLDAAGVEYDN